MSFSLFELKPMAYEHYMKLFGHVNATQMSTQTTNRAADQDCQTDTKPRSTMWTQCPPQITADPLNRQYFEHRIGCGQEIGDVEIDYENNDCVMDIEQSLMQIDKLNHSSKISVTDRLNSIANTISMDRLSWFLQKASTTISSVIGAQYNRNVKEEEDNAFIVLDCRQHSALSRTKVHRIFGNFTQNDVLYTVQSSDDDKQESSSLIVIWNTLSPDSPLRVLSSWSGVVCMETVGHLVYAGLEDG